MSRSARKALTLCLIALASGAWSGCGDAPVVTSVNTLCTSLDRYHTTDEERAKAAMDWPSWKGIFTYLAKVATTWDGECLKPARTP